MRHIILREAEDNVYPLVILIKDSALKSAELKKYFVEPLEAMGVTVPIVAVELPYKQAKTVPKKATNDYFKEHLPDLLEVGVTHIICCDSANYFKSLTNAKKVEPHYGELLPCTFEGYEDEGIQITVAPNYQALFYNPDMQSKIDLALQATSSSLLGNYQALGSGIIHRDDYPLRDGEFAKYLESLHQYPVLTADIETFDLKHYKAGLGSIAFAWSKHEGMATVIDYLAVPPSEKAKKSDPKGVRIYNKNKRASLRKFFEEYKGMLIWHNINFDVKVLIYELWMDHLLDQKGLLKGLEVMTRSMRCTQIISYLATNNCVQNNLSLKAQAHEFAGNWAHSDIKNILMIPQDELLKYNLIDCLSTWYVFEKNWPKLLADDQESVYWEIFHPSIRPLIQTELSGNPLNMNRVKEVNKILQDIADKAIEEIHTISYMDTFLSDNQLIQLNPNSNPQLQKLIFDFLEYEPVAKTKAGMPSTDSDSLKELALQARTDDDKKLFKALISYGEVATLLSNFISNMLEAPQANDGWHYIFGSFKQGGTISGRLSSSNINLQNLPSAGNPYSKLIKSCFQAPPGWLFVGADFNGLEDVVNALLTKDPNKLMVLIKGHDGHSYRASFYFPEELGHIEKTVAAIKEIKKLYPHLRDASKPVTFALQYFGTYKTLMVNCGFSEEESKAIVANYDAMYQVSKDWVAAKLEQAKIDGYITLAYGLRLRTPLLSLRPDTSAGASESRSAGNAVSGQSYNMANTKAAAEFMEEVWNSPYKEDIKPIMQIHDAQYYLIREDSELLHWLNIKVPYYMRRQPEDLPELHHPELGFNAELDVHYRGWHEPITLPNEATEEEILEICQTQAVAYNEK